MIKGIDITKEGTGQLGGSNAGKLLGWPIMVISGTFDVLKAFLTLFIFENYLITDYFNEQAILNFVFDKNLGLLIISIGILIGHIKSIFIRLYSKNWHGGKGAAPYGGILIFISWISFVIIYIILFAILQGFKRLLVSKSNIYDNFKINFILILVSPFIVLLLIQDQFYFVWMLVLIAILGFFERKKLISLII